MAAPERADGHIVTVMVRHQLLKDILSGSWVFAFNVVLG